MLSRATCKLSIIVPVYNAEQYIERCMESLLQSTYGGVEILCVNDGSTDSSGHKCEKFALRDNRVRVIHQSNKGLPSVRNLGISLARGEYIAFVDSDDWIDSGLFENFVKVMDRAPEIDVCVSGSVREYPDGSTVSMFEDSIPRLFSGDEALKEMVIGRCFFWYMWGKVYRRSVFEGFSADETVTTCEDFDSLWQVFRSGRIRNVWYSPIYKYHYYYNMCGMTEGEKRIERYKSDLYVFEKILKDSDKEDEEILNLIRIKAIQTVYSILRECFFLNEWLERVDSYIGKGVAVMDRLAADVKRTNIVVQRLEQMANDNKYAKEFFGNAFFSMRKAILKAGNFPKKYIYGTGIVSQYITNMMREKGDFNGYVLSDSRPRTLIFAGKPVYRISELAVEDEKAIILAVNGKNRAEIMSGLKADKNTTMIIPNIPDDF